MRFAVAAALLGSLSSTGCFNSLEQGSGQGSNVLAAGGNGGCQGAGCRRGAAAGGGGGASSGGSSSGGSSGAGASSGGGGSTSGGAASTSSSSSGGNASGGTTGGFDAGVNCPQLYLASQALDLALQTPVAGATISAIGVNGVTIPGAAASSDANGYFAVCVPPNVEFSLSVQATGYPNFAMEDVTLQQSETLEFATGGMPLVSQSDLDAFSTIVPYDSSRGAVLVTVNSQSKKPLCYDSAGWQLSIGLPDGGTLPDGGGLQYQRVYLDNTLLPNPTLTETTTVGDAFFYDIDTTVTSRVSITAVNTNSNAAQCPIINGELGLQSTAYVAEQVLTFAPILNP